MAVRPVPAREEAEPQEPADDGQEPAPRGSRQKIVQAAPAVAAADQGECVQTHDRVEWDFELDRLVALCPPCHAPTDAPYLRPAGDHAERRRPVHVRGHPRDRQVGGARIEGSRRWAVLWVHYEAEELRVHHRATIAPDYARAIVRALLASGRVPPVQPRRLGLQLPGARPILQRFWGTICQHDETAYLILFIPHFRFER